MMRIGFSTLACPDWDLNTIADRASAMGYDGVELHGVQGEWHLPDLPELADRPDEIREVFQARKVAIVCLSTRATLSSRWRRQVAEQRAAIVEFVKLANRLGCPCVRLGLGDVQPGDDARQALARTTEALMFLVPAAIAAGVTLLIENSGSFPGSGESWFLVDAIGHPSVQCCWNQCTAMAVLEKATVSVPRLVNRIGLVHLCDGLFDERGALRSHELLGEGSAEVDRQIELLKGLMYRGVLIFEWPKALFGSLRGPEVILPEAIKYLRKHVEEKQPVLSAYKGDKYAPKLAAPTATLAAH